MSAPTPPPNDEDRVDAELGRRPDSRIRFEELPNGRHRLTDLETGAVAEGPTIGLAADELAVLIQRIYAEDERRPEHRAPVPSSEEIRAQRPRDQHEVAMDRTIERLDSGDVPLPPTIPWTIKKYDRHVAGSIVEIRTAFYRCNLLIAVLRADGSGTTIIGAGSTTANEIRWDDITQGLEYLDELYAGGPPTDAEVEAAISGGPSVLEQARADIARLRQSLADTLDKGE